jgi:hypothetical protein
MCLVRPSETRYSQRACPASEAECDGPVTSGRDAGLTVPIWYSYEPGGELRVVTGRTSRKAQLLQHAGRFSVCVQTETWPYKYVSVEGPVVAIEPADVERDRRPIAHRYFGAQRGDRYIEKTRLEYAGNVVVRMLPERWLTVDYAKAGAP